MSPKTSIRIVVICMVLAIDQIATLMLKLGTTDSLLFFMVIMSTVIFLTQVEDDPWK